MTHLEMILIAIIWLILGAMNIIKQHKLDVGEVTGGYIAFMVVLCICFAPLFFIGAVIRQVVIEDWK